MNPSPDHSIGDMLRETAHRLFQTHCDMATQRAADQDVWPAALWVAIEEAALNRALVPEEAGGFGVDITDALSLLRVAGAHALPVPLAETMLASRLLAEAGIPIPDGPLSIGPVRDGEIPELTRTAGGWHLTGTVARIPWARNADHLAVVAQHNGKPWLALAAAKSTEPGENIAREPRDTVRFDGPVIAAAPATITHPVLKALGAAMRTQQIAGALTRLTEVTTQYAQDRVQFGRPIGKFQAVQQNLAVLAGQTAAAGADRLWAEITAA
jgi:acyl-CoA dehydrogenase